MKKTLCFMLLAVMLLNAKTFNTPMQSYMEGLHVKKGGIVLL